MRSMEQGARNTERVARKHGARSTEQGARSTEHGTWNWMEYIIFLNEITKTVCEFIKILFQLFISIKILHYCPRKSLKSSQALSIFEIFRFRKLLKFSYECIFMLQTLPRKRFFRLSNISIWSPSKEYIPATACSDESDDILANLAISASNLWILSSLHLYFSYNLDVVETVNCYVVRIWLIFFRFVFYRRVLHSTTLCINHCQLSSIFRLLPRYNIFITPVKFSYKIHWTNKSV